VTSTFGMPFLGANNASRRGRVDPRVTDARRTERGLRCANARAGQDRATAVSKAVATATTMDRMPPKRVLIVDDQPDIRRVLRELLVSRGFAVVGEADGLITALAAFQQCEPDAVLIDVCLGNESGFDVARVLTGLRPGIPVLLVSTDDWYEDQARVRECGARGFVSKSRLVDADFGRLWR
jgi:CheY-like chemotaxis protein